MLETGLVSRALGAGAGRVRLSSFQDYLPAGGKGPFSWASRLRMRVDLHDLPFIGFSGIGAWLTLIG